jgi:hypothetical protein
VVEVFVVRTFYFSGGSCIVLDRQCHREISLRVTPTSDTAYWIVKQFEETGTVDDKHADGRRLFNSFVYINFVILVEIT